MMSPPSSTDLRRFTTVQNTLNATLFHEAITKHKQPSLILLGEIEAAGCRISVEACSPTNTAMELGLTALKHTNIAIIVRYPRSFLLLGDFRTRC
ncbi:hypothetical protein A2U01_0032862 [Trifolium medium]|uniref:Uncharacterized protein n=1 Tax=Trifolium medium TaxID=97028 RepID=A0A392PJX1_9FABA|nr:hypothetical protein [Trifolium medium]